MFWFSFFCKRFPWMFFSHDILPKCIWQIRSIQIYTICRLWWLLLRLEGGTTVRIVRIAPLAQRSSEIPAELCSGLQHLDSSFHREHALVDCADVTWPYMIIYFSDMAPVVVACHHFGHVSVGNALSLDSSCQMCQLHFFGSEALWPSVVCLLNSGRILRTSKYNDWWAVVCHVFL